MWVVIGEPVTFVAGLNYAIKKDCLTAVLLLYKNTLLAQINAVFFDVIFHIVLVAEMERIVIESL